MNSLLLKITAAGVLPLTAFGVHAAEVSDIEIDEILSIAQYVEKASESRDVDGVMKYLADDVRVEISNAGGNSARVYDYSGYREFLSRAFPLMSDYRHERSNESFTTADNGEDVIFKFTLIEQYMFNNDVHAESHAETWYLRKAGNGYVVYRVIAD